MSAWPRVLLAVWVTLAATVLPQSADRVRVIRDAVVLGEPRESAATVAAVAPGDVLEVLDAREDWLLVRPLPGSDERWRTGWIVSTSLLRLEAGTTGAQPAMPAPGLPAPAAAPAADGGRAAGGHLFSVVSHHFTTEVAGSGSRLTVTDPMATRHLVLLIEARFPPDRARLFTYDFVLRYRRNNADDRTGCRAIAPGNPAADDRFGTFQIGYGSSIPASAEGGLIGLACIIEHGVDEVLIYQLGVAEPVAYSIGTERPHSIFLTTNRPGENVDPVVDVLRRGGYSVQTSRGLQADVEGVTIHYASKAEGAAREISQRLMTGTGLVPTVKPMTLVSKYDVIVWLGRSRGPE